MKIALFSARDRENEQAKMKSHFMQLFQCQSMPNKESRSGGNVFAHTNQEYQKVKPTFLADVYTTNVPAHHEFIVHTTQLMRANALTCTLLKIA